MSATDDRTAYRRVIQVRVSKEQHEAIRATAEGMGMGISAFVRMRALGAVPGPARVTIAESPASLRAPEGIASGSRPSRAKDPESLTDAPSGTQAGCPVWRCARTGPPGEMCPKHPLWAFGETMEG